VFIVWLTWLIQEGRALERRRPQCLFYCFGFRLGMLPPGSPSLPAAEEERHRQLIQVWQSFMVPLLRRLPAFPETEQKQEELFLTWAARGLQDARRSLANNPALEIALLLYKQTPGLALLAPTTAERQSAANLAMLEQLLRLLIWEWSP
jgi:hypothetical protein